MSEIEVERIGDHSLVERFDTPDVDTADANNTLGDIVPIIGTTRRRVRNRVASRIAPQAIHNRTEYANTRLRRRGNRNEITTVARIEPQRGVTRRTRISGAPRNITARRGTARANLRGRGGIGARGRGGLARGAGRGRIAERNTGPIRTRGGARPRPVCAGPESTAPANTDNQNIQNSGTLARVAVRTRRPRVRNLLPILAPTTVTSPSLIPPAAFLQRSTGHAFEQRRTNFSILDDTQRRVAQIAQDHLLPFLESQQQRLHSIPRSFISESNSILQDLNNRLLTVYPIEDIIQRIRQRRQLLQDRPNELATNIPNPIDGIVNEIRRSILPTLGYLRARFDGGAGVTIPQSEITEAFIAETCRICLEHYQTNDVVAKLNCSHVFHKNCVDVWARNSNSCPLCRHRISESETEIVPRLQYMLNYLTMLRSDLLRI